MQHMAMATINVTVPAVVAAVGFYLFDRRNPKAFGGMVPVSTGGILANAKKDVKSTQLPRLAPQFDGLHSFETLVNH